MRRKNRFHCMRRGIGLAGLCLGLAFGPACQPTPKTGDYFPEGKY